MLVERDDVEAEFLGVLDFIDVVVVSDAAFSRSK